jgi:hypothetical protein
VPPGRRERAGRTVARDHLDPEAAYYQAVEEFFVSRRGDPLFLSHADWHRVSKWRRAGMPLRIVLRGIADALDSHALSWSRRRKVGSLSYCAAEVEAAWERWQRAVSFSTEEGAGVATFLEGLCGSLEALAARDGSASSLAVELAEEIRSRAESDPLHIEGWLRTKEGEMVVALEAQMGRQAIAGIVAAVRADLAPYRRRMPDKVAARIEAESLARRILEAHGLPRFGLFDS